MLPPKDTDVNIPKGKQDQPSYNYTAFLKREQERINRMLIPATSDEMLTLTEKQFEKVYDLIRSPRIIGLCTQPRRVSFSTLHFLEIVALLQFEKKRLWLDMSELQEELHRSRSQIMIYHQQLCDTYQLLTYKKKHLIHDAREYELAPLFAKLHTLKEAHHG